METKNPCLARLNPANLNTLNTYIIRLAVTLFCRIFTGEGTTGIIGYIGCDSKEHKEVKG
jgi:hypothetical protein